MARKSKLYSYQCATCRLVKENHPIIFKCIKCNATICEVCNNSLNGYCKDCAYVKSDDWREFAMNKRNFTGESILHGKYETLSEQKTPISVPTENLFTPPEEAKNLKYCYGCGTSYHKKEKRCPNCGKK